MQRKQKKWNNNGSTLAEVMVSFAILAASAAVFFHVYIISGRVMAQTVELMAEKETFYEDYYLDEGISRECVGGGHLIFRRIDESGSEEFFTVNGLEVYRSISTEGKRGKIYDVSPK